MISYCLILSSNVVTYSKQRWLLLLNTSSICKLIQTLEAISNGFFSGWGIQRKTESILSELWISLSKVLQSTVRPRTTPPKWRHRTPLYHKVLEVLIHIQEALLEVKGLLQFIRTLSQEYFLSETSIFRKFTSNLSKQEILNGAQLTATNLSLWRLVSKEKGRIFWPLQLTVTKKRLMRLRLRS